MRFRPGLRPIASLAAAALSSAIPTAPGADLPGLPLVEVLATQLRLSRLGLIEVYAQLPRAGTDHLLVVVDQFEELFRNETLREGGMRVNDVAAREEARGLVNLLLAAIAQTTRPIYVVLTMRSDFLGDCARFPGLTETISWALQLMPRLSREERRQAIANAALVSGTEVDPTLLTRRVNDVGDDPDQLSILQHALRRTWSPWMQRGGRGSITLADYEAIGTMATALDSHTERLWGVCCCWPALLQATAGANGSRRVSAAPGPTAPWLPPFFPSDLARACSKAWRPWKDCFKIPLKPSAPPLLWPGP